MGRPADMPTAERFACGTRARYVCGCRCDDCRRANREYARGRARAEFNGLVAAERARAHLVALSAAGVGKRAVAASSDVALTVIAEIRQGLKKQIRAATERRILSVDAGAIADHAVVSAKEALAAVRLMRRAGYTKGEIAQRLGAQTPALQIALKGRMLARTRLAVERLAREVAAELAAEKALADVCGTCGYSHDPANRLRLISRMVEGGATAGEVIEEWSCFYGGGRAGKRLGYRDVAQLLANASRHLARAAT